MGLSEFSLAKWFHVDTLSIIMLMLVGLIAVLIYHFSDRYLEGDPRRSYFLKALIILSCSVAVMVAADQLFLFWLAWTINNLILVRMMIHNPKWRAAKASGFLALKIFVFSSVCLAFSFGLMAILTGETGIQTIIHSAFWENPMHEWVLCGLFIAGMAQSAIWPFQGWLLSSLNSPTPVSAFMHAGLVNAGGFLLVRFAPLYVGQEWLLQIIFATGVLTACLGTSWKLIQNDNKRMLACSTMAQMGCMMMQCGLGLFSAAVAHLCWHGLFKAYLFLSSGGVAQEKREREITQISFGSLVFAGCLGAWGSFVFSSLSGKPWLTTNTHLILTGLVFIAIMQFALTILSENPSKKLPMAWFMSTLGAACYGLSVGVVRHMLLPLGLDIPHALQITHALGFGALALGWLITLLLKHQMLPNIGFSWQAWAYMKLLNASQPHPKTITVHHNHYHQ